MSVFFLFGVAFWVIVEKKDDWLLDQMQSFMNESQSGQLKIGSLDFKLFRSFPAVTIELDSIDYYEHRDSLRAPEEKPILRAGQLFIAFKLFPLLRDELIVSEISLSHAQLNIIEWKDGTLNIERALAKPQKGLPNQAVKKIVPKPKPTPPVKKKTTPPKVSSPSTPGIQIDLQLIDLREVLITWNAHSVAKPTALLMKSVKAELVKDGHTIVASLTSAHEVKALAVREINLPRGELKFSTVVRYDVNQQLLTVDNSDIKFDDFTATLRGSYAHQKNQLLDVRIDASANDMQFLNIFVKPEVIKQNPSLLNEGHFYAQAKVFGELKKQRPQFDISFGVKDLDLELPKKMGAFRKVGFNGSFASGVLPDYSEGKFEIDNLHGQLPGGFLKGHFHLRNFLEPEVNYQLDTKLKLDGFDQIFRIDFIKQLSGTVSLQAKFEGPLKLLDNHRMDSSRSSTIAFDSLSFVLTKTNQPVSLSGKTMTRDNQSAVQLAFTYGENDVTINATIGNLMYFIFKRENNISVTGHLQSNTLLTKDFIPDTLLTAQVQDQINNLSLDFKANTSTGEEVGRFGLPDISFELINLSFRPKELPDVRRADATGLLRDAPDGFRLDLTKFQATMPYGRVDVTGDLFIPERVKWQFNAHVKMNKFPWTYIMELVAEIQDGKEPTGKNIPFNEMEIVTADLDLSASIFTFPFDITKLIMQNSRIHFALPHSKPVTVDQLNLDFENLYFKHPKNSGDITGLKSTKGKVQMKQLGVPGLRKFDIDLNIMGHDDQLDMEFLTASQKAKSEKGKLSLTLSGKEPQYHLNFAVKKASLENYIRKFYKKKLMTGDINYMLDIRSAGWAWGSIKENLSGNIEITGDSLQLHGVDIDKVLRKYEKSQNFNLTDLGAVLIAGPVGLAVTKGTDFVSLASINLDSSQHTRIQTLLTRWKLEDRQLITEDVALATTQNRIAFDGRIDFAKDSIPGLTIAVVDKHGCSLMDQKLQGKIGAVKAGKLNITKTLFGSVINFVNAVVGKDCKTFYDGEVKAPLN